MKKDPKVSKEGQDDESGFLKKINREKGFRKAAEFILLLGKDEANKIFKNLNEEEVQGILEEMISIGSISGPEAERVLEEFGYIRAKTREGREEVRGGLEKAREILSAALGDKAEGIIKKVQMKIPRDHFAFLAEAGDEELFGLLHDESNAVLSLVMAKIPSARAAKLYSRLQPEQQKEIAFRIARMERISPEILSTTSDSLKKKLYRSDGMKHQEFDGKSALLKILRQMEFGSGRMIVESLADEKPDLAQLLSKELFTMAIIEKIPEKQLSGLFRELADRSIALILMGETEKIKEIVMKSVSQHRRDDILEESELLGDVKKQEVRKEKDDFMRLLEKKVGDGDIIIAGENDLLV